MGLTNPGRAFGRFSLLLMYRKLLTRHPALFHKLISAGPLPCFARWTQSFLSDRCACVVSCSRYADDLAIWSSSASVPTAVEASQGALFRLEPWSEYWCLPLKPRKSEVSFFLVDPHQANFHLNLLLIGSRLRFNPTPTFLGVTFYRTFSY